MLFRPASLAHHGLLVSSGWKVRPSVGSTHANYIHPKTGGAVTVHSNGSWEHNNLGKTVREGSSHIDLKKYLGGSQHTEEEPMDTEQFKEPLHLGNGWYFHKTAMDGNGNHRVHVSKGANRGFSIQTNGVLPHTHRIGKGQELTAHAKKELLNHLEKTRGVSQHAEDNHIPVWAVPHGAGKTKGKLQLFSKKTGYAVSSKLFDNENDAASHVEELNKKPNMMRKFKFHSSTQHEEEPKETPVGNTMLHPSLATFGPAILMKKKPETTTQHAEHHTLAGSSAFLAEKGRRFNKRLHQILRQHGGVVHNAHGGFTLPKKAQESFNQSAHDAGFQHGHHYSLNG